MPRSNTARQRQHRLHHVQVMHPRRVDLRKGRGDPFQTLAISRYSLRETAGGGSARAPSARTASEVCVDTKRAYKSFRYKAKTDWTSARRGTLSASGKSHIVVGSPPELKGQPDVWAPEALLVGSVNTCLMLTFLTLAQAKSLVPLGYESEADGRLENFEG